jgi:DMSO/TMAO reductase YedYZ heme-binding membrane subunit
MKYLVGLAAAVLITFVCRKAVKKTAFVFYLLAIGYDVLLIFAVFNGATPWVWRYVLFAVQNCSLAMGFFTVVMFTGVLSDRSALKRQLVPIRAELSILACLLTAGHVYLYARMFLIGLFTLPLSMSVLQLTATLAAVALVVVLMLPLLITSFNVVRQRMAPKVWKRLQRLAYPFFALIYLHLLMFLLPSALGGSQTVAINLSIYTVMFVLYLVLRLKLHMRTRH